MFSFTDSSRLNRVLIADRASADLDEVVSYLEREGFEVHTVESGKDLIQAAGMLKPQLILLEVLLPDTDGIELLRELKEKHGQQNTIISLYSVRGEDYSQIAAFNAGADDYIVKPVRPRLLASRLKALLKRAVTTNARNGLLDTGKLKIDLEHYVVYKDNQRLQLPNKEFRLLSLLATKPGKVFTRELIMKEVWGSEISATYRTIDVHIRRIREKIGEGLIITVKGIGYKLEHRLPEVS